MKSVILATFAALLSTGVLAQQQQQQQPYYAGPQSPPPSAPACPEGQMAW